jgi:hypothetical protein
MSERRRWKCRAMDAEENQRQVSLRAHRPWKSQTARFPHSHRRDEAVEKWKAKGQASYFPTARFVISNSKQKGGPAAGGFAPATQRKLDQKNKPALQAHPSMRICSSCGKGVCDTGIARLRGQGPWFIGSCGTAKAMPSLENLLPRITQLWALV